MVPTMLLRVLDSDPGPYESSATVLLGGASIPTQLVERALDSGLNVLTTYGLTEACSQVATVVPGEERDSLGTAGPPLDGVEVSIVDDGGRVALCGADIGRIAVRGPTVSPGYIGETEKNLSFLTGDIGRLDELGRLVVLGRADDVIVTGGENVHPAEVEAVLTAHPSVAEAAVYGLPDDDWGQLVVAAVVVSPDVRLNPTDLAEHARRSLPAAAIPRRWSVVSDLPHNPVGKLDRRALRGRLMANGQ